MRTPKIIRRTGTALTGLAALVVGAGGCPGPQVENLPVNNVTFYEKDVQHNVNNTITPEIAGFCAENAEVSIIPLDTKIPRDVPLPWDYSVVDNQIVLSDNGNSFYDCDERLVEVGVRNKSGVLTDRQLFTVSYCPGFSNPSLEQMFTEQINEIHQEITNINEEITEIQEQLPPAPEEPQFKIGDGICSPGEPADSLDCVPKQPTELEKLVDWACVNLPRASGADTRIYQVTPTSGGFEAAENLELAITDPEYSIVSHILPSNVISSYWVAVAGSVWGNEKRMVSGYNEQALNPEECPSILILNSDKNPLIGGGLYSVGVGEYAANAAGQPQFNSNYTEDVRVKP